LGVKKWKFIDQSGAFEAVNQQAASTGPAGGIHSLPPSIAKNDPDGEDEADDEEADDSNYRELLHLSFSAKKMSTQQVEMKQPNSHLMKEAKKQKSSVEPHSSTGNYGNYDDEQLRGLPEIERITRLFNLLSHDNIYISEQISILLANVSNSSYFRHIFVTDRCMKSLLKILRDQNNDQVARVSQLAALIVVLNLTSMNDIVIGMENMKFMQTLQDIIKDDNLPYVNKSISLLAISNIQTVSKKVMTQISA
jgi:hypothetical protein